MASFAVQHEATHELHPTAAAPVRARIIEVPKEFTRCPADLTEFCWKEFSLVPLFVIEASGFICIIALHEKISQNKSDRKGCQNQQKEVLSEKEEIEVSPVE